MTTVTSAASQDVETVSIPTETVGTVSPHSEGGFAAYDADGKLMGIGSVTLRNLGPGVTSGRGMINVQPYLGRDVASASCRVALVIP